MDTLTHTVSAMQLQKTIEDLRESERRFGLLQKRLDFANGVARQLKDTLAISHGDKLIMDWLQIGNAERKLRKVLEVLGNPQDSRNSENVRAVFTAVAKDGA